MGKALGANADSMAQQKSLEKGLARVRAREASEATASPSTEESREGDGPPVRAAQGALSRTAASLNARVHTGERPRAWRWASPLVGAPASAQRYSHRPQAQERGRCGKPIRPVCPHSTPDSTHWRKALRMQPTGGILRSALPPPSPPKTTPRQDGKSLAPTSDVYTRRPTLEKSLRPGGNARLLAHGHDAWWPCA